MNRTRIAATLAGVVALSLTGAVLAQEKPADPQPVAADGPRASSPPTAPNEPTATPADAPPPDEAHAYRLRTDDEVEISVHRPGSFDAQVVRRLVVPTDGDVSFAPIGRLKLNDRTAYEIESEIGRRLREKNFLTQPSVACVVTKYAARNATVIGALHQSVQLPVYKDMRILDLLSRVGAFGAEGVDLEHVEVRRTNADGMAYRFNVNVDDIYAGEDETNNVVVREGDIIKIPRVESSLDHVVYVMGHVGRPGAVKIPREHSEFTLVKLIAVCGDFTDFANRSKVRVTRRENGRRVIREYDVGEIMDGKKPDVAVEAEDVVYVPESFF